MSKGVRHMWLGLLIMVALVVGIVVWMVWAVKRDKAKTDKA